MEIRMSRAVSSFAFAAIFLVATSLAEHSTTAITDVDRDDAKKQTDEIDKYQDVRGGIKQLREPETYLERLLSDELEKRASMRGFQGMRGKKSAAYYTGQPSNPAERFASYYYGPYADFYSAKRAPMGFQGMRGKKSAVDDYKRAPMGFQGMRGKKSFEEVLQDELDKRAMMGFQGMRGKKSEDYEEVAEEPSDIAEWSKRAPMGFQGMRGRKSFLDELDELEKRALLGFHGMRGKKDMAYEREDAPMELENYAKRPMMMGFHGMRGKRSVNYYDRRQ